MEKKGIDYFYSCGRCWLTFDGYAIAMQGDLCRDPELRDMFNSRIWEDFMIKYVAERGALPVSEIKNENQMNADISRRNTIENDARTLEKTAAYLREFANKESSENYQEELRTLRAHIKCAMEVLLYNLPT